MDNRIDVRNAPQVASSCPIHSATTIRPSPTPHTLTAHLKTDPTPQWPLPAGHEGAPIIPTEPEGIGRGRNHSIGSTHRSQHRQWRPACTCCTAQLALWQQLLQQPCKQRATGRFLHHCTGATPRAGPSARCFRSGFGECAATDNRITTPPGTHEQSETMGCNRPDR